MVNQMPRSGVAAIATTRKPSSSIERRWSCNHSSNSPFGSGSTLKTWWFRVVKLPHARRSLIRSSSI